MRMGLIPAILFVIAALASSASAEFRHAGPAVPHTGPAVYDKAGKCRAGYDYDPATKTCIRKRRGSHSGG